VDCRDESDATAEQIDHMVTHIASLGMTPQVIQGNASIRESPRIGEERPGLTEALEPGEGVEKVLPIMAPYKRPRRSCGPSAPSSAPATSSWAAHAWR